MKINVYVYKEEDLTVEYFYQKKWLMSFISDLGYFGGGTSMDEDDRKCLQRLINIQLLIKARS